jgi:hypothetical protein
MMATSKPVPAAEVIDLLRAVHAALDTPNGVAVVRGSLGYVIEAWETRDKHTIPAATQTIQENTKEEAP